LEQYIQDEIPLDYDRLYKKVESILVCTGVYNPKSDWVFHLRNVFVERTNNLKSDENRSIISNSNPSRFRRVDSSGNLIDSDKKGVKKALSRKNSFVNYFDDKLNVPDMVVGNLLDAVDYIITNSEFKQSK
jgi:hypothetical protein